jgi:CBS domain-containing protein
MPGGVGHKQLRKVVTKTKLFNRGLVPALICIKPIFGGFDLAPLPACRQPGEVPAFPAGFFLVTKIACPLTWLKIAGRQTRQTASSTEAAMNAQDVMTQYVISVGPNDSMARAIRAMLQNDVSGLPVLDTDGRLVGMITEGDLLRRAEMSTQRRRPRWLEFLVGPGRLADEYAHTHGRKVSELMTVEPCSVTEDTPLDEVVTLMEKRRIKRLPVVRGEKVVGIVSRANLLHALARIAGEAKPVQADDRVIREQLLAELSKQSWAPLGALEIIVRDGVVDLWGAITDERARPALIVAAENVAGVKGVNDHLVWIDTVSDMPFVPIEGPATALPKAS